MTQLALFDIPAPPAPDKRRRAMNRAYGKADAKWKAAYEKFILEFLSRGPAIAETIRLAYEARKDLPQLVAADKRASGGTFQRLLHKRKIERTGEYGISVSRCSPMPVYRKV